MGLNLKIRCALEEDIPLIIEFVRELAEYERLAHEVVASEDVMREWLFEKRTAEAIIGELDGEPVAFALFFHNFSTFLGRSGIYLEDLFLRPEARGKGIGKAMFKHIAELTVERGCGRLEWWCLDWNKPSIDFYESFGAEAMSDWTVYRLTGETLKAFADG